MTVYYYDLFSGSAGTPLISTTADSGATWSMLTGTSPSLDGNGFIYGSAVGGAMTNASMPATQNFEVQLDLKRISAVSGQHIGVMLLGKNFPSDSADHYDFMYVDGGGFFWGLNGVAQNGLFGSSVLGVGSTVRIKLVLSTASGNTTFAAWYSTDSGSSWTAFGNNLVIPTPAYAPNVSVLVTGTGVSETTGTHLGRLVVQDPAPSTATPAGPSSGSIGVQSAAFTATLDEAAQCGGLTVIPTSSAAGTDTFQDTSGGGNVLNVSEINFGTEGGTVSSPAPTTLMTFQPTDTTKGPWQLISYDMAYSGIHDSVLSLGYNGGFGGGTPPIPAEPQWVMNMEQDYWNASTSAHCAEWYVQFVTAGGSGPWRPIGVSLNRASGNCIVSCEIGPGGDPHYGAFAITANYAPIFEVGATQVECYKPLYAGIGTGNGQLNINCGSGAQSLLCWQDQSSYKWQMYLISGDAHLYLRDLANSRMHVTYTPGSTATTSVTGFNGALTTAGPVGLNGASQPSSGLAVTGPITATGTLTAPIAGPLTSQSAAYTATVANRVILCSAASAGWALSLPGASTMVVGFELIIKKTDNTSNAITITPSGSDKIDGASSYALSAQYQYVHLICDGSANWYMMGAGTM